MPGTPVAPPISTSSPPSNLSARERIDRFWSDFGNVGCQGLGAPDTLKELSNWSDLIVIGRPLAAQDWAGPPNSELPALVSFRVSEVLKGSPTYWTPGIIRLGGEQLDRGSVADIDHLLMLGLNKTLGTYHLTDGFISIYANVDGKVVTPKFAELQGWYGDHILSVPLDGTSFNDLVNRVTNFGTNDSARFQLLAKRGYFAC